MNTAGAAGLGVPLMNERTQKIALAAQAADPSDAKGAKLLARAAAAKHIADAQTATIDLQDPAPPIAQILQEATLDASTKIESPKGTVPLPEAPPAAVVKKAATKKPAAKKTSAKKPAPAKAGPKKAAPKKAVAKAATATPTRRTAAAKKEA